MFNIIRQVLFKGGKGYWLLILTVSALIFLCVHNSIAIGAEGIKEAGGDLKQFNWKGKRLSLSIKPDGSFEVTDKLSGKTWQWKKLEGVEVRSITEKKDGFRLQLARGEFSLMAAFDINPEEDSISIRLSGEKDGRIESFKFPGLSISTADHLVLPMSEGLLIPPDDLFLSETLKWKGLSGKFSISGYGNGISMPWVGFTDFKAGLMVLVEDSVDVRFEINQLSKGFSVGLIWLPIMGKFGKERVIRLIFPDKGGYVSMAKAYRDYLKEKGEWVSLEQKSIKNEKVRRLAGALDIWLRGLRKFNQPHAQKDEDTLEKIIDLLAEKIKPRRCLISLEFHTGPQYLYKKKRELVERIRKIGFFAGRYISYFTVFPKENLGSIGKGFQEEQYRKGYPEEVCRLADGSLKKGFLASTKRTPEGKADLEEGTVQGFRRNTKIQREWVKKDFPRIKAQANYDGLFVDVAGAAPPMECYNSDNLLTRREDIEYRKKYLQLLGDEGYILGTENGASWVVPFVHYLEGIGTIQEASIRGVRVGVTPFETTPLYEGVNLSEYYRIPLFQLVFHDAVFSTFRWNYTPDRYKNRSLWKKHDLFILLYGYMPIFVEDYETLKERGNLLKDSITPILDWHSKIGMDELVDHRYLTKDRKAQESRFSSGWAIVVNFGDQKFKTDFGKEVAPMSYLTYKWKQE